MKIENKKIKTNNNKTRTYEKQQKTNQYKGIINL